MSKRLNVVQNGTKRGINFSIFLVKPDVSKANAAIFFKHPTDINGKKWFSRFFLYSLDALCVFQFLGFSFSDGKSFPAVPWTNLMDLFVPSPSRYNKKNEAHWSLFFQLVYVIKYLFKNPSIFYAERRIRRFGLTDDNRKNKINFYRTFRIIRPFSRIYSRSLWTLNGFYFLMLDSKTLVVKWRANLCRWEWTELLQRLGDGWEFTEH